jgi:hypothetical protein
MLATVDLAAQAPVEVYGNINLTVTRDSGLATTTSATSEDTRNIFEFSQRTTKIGLRWSPTPLEDWNVASRLEFDLQGGTGSTLQPRLRHAYFSMAQDSWEFLTGQTWDVIAPLRADSINFPAESWPGDIGQRRPQFRATWRAVSGGQNSVSVIVAVAQFTQGLEDPATGQVLETTHVPALMGRVTADFALAGEMAQVSVWGHAGQKGYSAHGNIHAGTIQTSSLGTSILLPFAAYWTFSGELWQGRVGDATYNPEVSRLNLSLADVIESRGGWCQMALKFQPKWRFNVGFGRQFPRSLKVVEQDTQRISSWYANAYRVIGKRFEVGLELSRWDSTFPGTTSSNSSLRGQLSLDLRF